MCRENWITGRTTEMKAVAPALLRRERRVPVSVHASVLHGCEPGRQLPPNKWLKLTRLTPRSLAPALGGFGFGNTAYTSKGKEKTQMSLRSKYARQVRRTFGSGYHAAWYPDTPHAIGAYGRMEDDVFFAYGNIRDLGVQYDIDQDTIPSALEVNMSEGVVITTKIAGRTNAHLPHIPRASAGLGIEFKAEGSFVIAAEQVYEDRIMNPGALEAQLRTLREQGRWDSSFRIVTGVLRMPVATILISQASNTKLELSLEGTLTPSIKELGKADVTANFHWESSAVMKYAPARNAVPIVQLHRLAPGFFFWRPRLRTFKQERIEAPGAEEVWRLVPDDQILAEVE